MVHGLSTVIYSRSDLLTIPFKNTPHPFPYSSLFRPPSLGPPSHQASVPSSLWPDVRFPPRARLLPQIISFRRCHRIIPRPANGCRPACLFSDCSLLPSCGRYHLKSWINRIEDAGSLHSCQTFMPPPTPERKAVSPLQSIMSSPLGRPAANRNMGQPRRRMMIDHHPRRC